LPIDTINRFWGVDSRILKQDETVQKQSFDQSYKNFWSFVDFNENLENYPTQNTGTQKNFTSSTFNNPVSSLQSSYTCGNSNPGVKLSYQEARKRADELLRTQKI
jgi:hypothetical protein